MPQLTYDSDVPSHRQSNVIWRRYWASSDLSQATALDANHDGDGARTTAAGSAAAGL